MTSHILRATKLGNVSKALQALHQNLLTFQATESGFVGSPLQLFDHATKDLAFAWLKPLRSTIVALDERRANTEPLTEGETKALGDQVRSILDTEFGPFRDRLNAAIQLAPETGLAIGAVRTSLGTLSQPQQGSAN